ncbi:MAG: fructose-6-phosphate aldolase [Dehalococcoidia bacterium]|nr:MAG: fructose-6-phosphate aldolase [Dehalococcoidia bacterium]
MRIFLDTANIDEIREAAKLGVVSGITTNPSLIAKERTTDMKAVIQEIASIIDGPISAEVLSLEPSAMIEEARVVSSWSPNVIVKIPMPESGLQVISSLSREGIRTNLTLCFSLNQALLGTIAGATYVSPFVGRLDDISHDGMQLVSDIVKVFDHFKVSTQVLAASIRHPLHVVIAAKAGAHIATIPYSVLKQMIRHPLTDIGIARFAEDWQNIPKE